MEIIKESVLQFEYKIMTYYGLMEEAVTQDILKKKNTSSEEVFNELGRDGWELSAVLQGKVNSIFIFKRAKWEEKKAQEKQEKQDDNSNKVERKFKVGDWIVNQHGPCRSARWYRHKQNTPRHFPYCLQ